MTWNREARAFSPAVAVPFQHRTTGELPFPFACFHRLFLLHEVFATVAQFTTFGVIVDLGVEAWARAVGDYIIEGIA